jgi:uncharacterized repeat protein (TIGR01451 family)
MPFAARYAHAASAVGDRLYVLGGMSSVPLTDVSYAMIDSAQCLTTDSWTSTLPLEPPTGRLGHAALEFEGRLYVIGGLTLTGGNYVPLASIYFAQPTATGAITQWIETSSLTYGLAYPAAFVVPSTRKIYVMVGWMGGNTVTNVVYSAYINQNGTLAQWEESSWHLPYSLHRHSAVVGNSGGIYLVGGQGARRDAYTNSTYYIPPLNLEKSSDPSGPVHEGDVITYTISYANTSLITQIITITDILPFNLTLVPNSTIPAAGQEEPRMVVWNLGGKSPGASGQVSFRARVALLPSLHPEGINVACPTPEPPPPPPARVLPAAVSCDTTRFWASGVTRQPPVSPPYTIEVQLPPNTSPSEMWLLMKGTDNTAPRVEGQPAQVLTSTHTAFGASVWTATVTSAMIEAGEVTVVTDNPRELNALFLFDAKDPPFDERDLRVFAEAPTTFTYTLEIPSVEASTMDVLLPFMDITSWTDSSPPEFDGRLTTVTVELEGEPTQTITVNQPNMGNGLLMTQFPINLRPFTDTITKTEVLTISVDSEDDTIYTLGPRVCRPVYVKNTAWLCSDRAGCISDTAVNPPFRFAPLSVYLPIILKSSP